MHVFHVTEAARWDAARLAGSYAWSTRGRSLADEGFIHCAREDQWQEVQRRYYGDVREPLVLLVIDTDRLASPWREDPVGDTTFPHIHGPLNLDAVVTAVPLAGPAQAAAAPAAAASPRPAAESRPEPGPSFTGAFLGEVTFRVVLALAVMALMTIGVLLAQAFLDPDAGLVGAAIGLVVGVLAAIPIARRRDARLARRP